MPDEPTLGEVVRRLEDIRQHIRDDIREIGERLDSKVSMERYLLELQAREEGLRHIAQRITTIEEARALETEQAREEKIRSDDRRRADRRLVITALIAPVLLLLLQTYLKARGAGT